MYVTSACYACMHNTLLELLPEGSKGAELPWRRVWGAEPPSIRWSWRRHPPSVRHGVWGVHSPRNLHACVYAYLACMHALIACTHHMHACMHGKVTS